jgi:hypothetical protein
MHACVCMCTQAHTHLLAVFYTICVMHNDVWIPKIQKPSVSLYSDIWHMTQKKISVESFKTKDSKHTNLKIYT